IELPGGLDENDVMILVPAPLPTSLIQKIYFPSSEEKKEFYITSKIQLQKCPCELVQDRNPEETF
ncbi:MAG: hypothetical protein U9N19_04340, partial [Thermodesulfobacteriota bacterium]|nr:hypothetical protein [Thermodesulfobacteriota bacterium]